MKIFRYYKAEHGISVLNDLELRTSIPNSLNDPFELSPNIDVTQFTQKHCETFLRADHNVEMWYQREGRERGFTSKKQFKRWYLKDIPRRAATLLPNVPTNVEDARKAFANTFSEHWRIVCASRVADSILMWSHYADNHSGFVIEFSAAEPPFSRVGNDYILTVAYSETKAEYFHSDKLPQFLKAMFTVAATKAQDWAYEQEIRFVLAASPKTLRVRRFLPLTPRSITAVYFGCRSSAVTKNAVRKALCHPELSHICLLQAELHPSEYALNFMQSA